MLTYGRLISCNFLERTLEIWVWGTEENVREVRGNKQQSEEITLLIWCGGSVSLSVTCIMSNDKRKHGGDFYDSNKKRFSHHIVFSLSHLSNFSPPQEGWAIDLDLAEHRAAPRPSFFCSRTHLFAREKTLKIESIENQVTFGVLRTEGAMTAPPQDQALHRSS